MSPADQCNYCATPIRWLITSTGKPMPVDAAPDAAGNVAVLGRTAAVLGPAKAQAARAAGVELHQHHAVNCPHATHWNRARR